MKNDKVGKMQNAISWRQVAYTVYTVYNAYTKGGDKVMAAKAVNFKLDENRLLDIRRVASVFNMTMTDVVNEALDAYLPMMKQDPFYRLTANVEEASIEESEEILSEIDSLSDDDLKIVATEQISL